jgi:hypothetical protein
MLMKQYTLKSRVGEACSNASWSIMLMKQYTLKSRVGEEQPQCLHFLLFASVSGS